MSYRASPPAQMDVAAEHMIGHSGRQMKLNLENLAARAAPAIFVVLWSTGFVATKYVLHNAEPLTYLSIRMAVVVGLMAVIVAIARPRWPDGMGVAHSVVAGHPGAWILSGRHRRRHRAFDPRGAFGANSGPATDPDLDAREPLARRTR